jgi:16S rRNA (guanine966-N2)-methyltransferase
MLDPWNLLSIAHGVAEGDRPVYDSMKEPCQREAGTSWARVLIEWRRRSMRIIAGQRRGHKFDGPKPSADMRPTSDLVRESLFNIVGGLVAGRVVVDLFAGTGAIGLEALSRGAERAIFIEKDRDNVGLIHRNIATLRYQDRTQVRLGDAYRWARTCRPPDDRPLAVFLDPPYREYEVRRRRVNQLLASLVDQLPAGSLIALEAGRGLEEVLPEFETWDIRRYGDTRIAIRVLSRAGAESSPPADDTPTIGKGEPSDAQEEHDV